MIYPFTPSLKKNKNKNTVTKIQLNWRIKDKIKLLQKKQLEDWEKNYGRKCRQSIQTNGCIGKNRGKLY